MFLTDEQHNTILAQALFARLEENEGIVVHNGDHAYIVAKLFDDEADQIQMKILLDDDMLKQEHLQMLWLHDEPFGTA